MTPCPMALRLPPELTDIIRKLLTSRPPPDATVLPPGTYANLIQLTQRDARGRDWNHFRCFLVITAPNAGLLWAKDMPCSCGLRSRWADEHLRWCRTAHESLARYARIFGDFSA